MNDDIDGTWNVSLARYSASVDMVAERNVLRRVDIETARAFFETHLDKPITLWPTGGAMLDGFFMLVDSTPEYRAEYAKVKRD